MVSSWSVGFNLIKNPVDRFGIMEYSTVLRALTRWFLSRINFKGVWNSDLWEWLFHSRMGVGANNLLGVDYLFALSLYTNT
jgi:hypothetical protein